jgi:hypothetical protein
MLFNRFSVCKNTWFLTYDPANTLVEARIPREIHRWRPVNVVLYNVIKILYNAYV